MLDFSQTSVLHVYGAFVGSYADEVPFKVTPTPLPINELTEQLFISKLEKGFRKTEKWFTIDDTRENATIISESITALLDSGKEPAPAQIMTDLSQRLHDVLSESIAVLQVSGEFLAVVLENVMYFDAYCNAVLLMKVTGKEIHLNITTNPISLMENWIIPAKFQLAGLFIDTGDGEYKVAVTDTITKRGQRSSWNEDFLCVVQEKDGYFFTEHWMNMIADFVTHSGAALGYNAADKADLKRRSLEYFNESPEFDQTTFEKLIFDTQPSRNKFADSVAKYQTDFNAQLPEDFEIVKAAVAANSILLRSRIVLDKNFTIDVDGRRDLIETGFDDEKGKKFMKLYYDFEN